MFKNAATKIAHNSTIPALAVGNKDLRPLQDLITAEKSVLISLQKFSVDLTKASDLLRTWGLGEGEDLADILSASTSILGSFAAALTQYSSHEHVIRDSMKSIRSREEALDELRRRRKMVVSKAEAAEKKLSKMSPEHKNLLVQTDTLNSLRDQIRGLDGDIMAEEASLSDFKRSAVRSFMGLKFGGLLECCEKGTIIGEYGKLLISEVPEDVTQPGMPRTMYNAHNQVASLTMEAQRSIDDVKLSTVSSSNPQTRPPRITNADQNDSLPNSPTGDGTFENRFGTDISPLPTGVGTGSRDFLGTPSTGLGMGHFLDPSDMSAISGTPTDFRPPAITTDDFGVNMKNESSTPILSVNEGPAGGRFATFPVKNRAGVTLRDDGFVSRPSPGGTIPDTSPLDPATATRGNFQGLPSPHEDVPVPPYDTIHNHLPPGAAPPADPWKDHQPDQEEVRQSTFLESDAHLAYMDDHSEGGDRHSRHVRFGGGSDVDIRAELDKREVQSLSPEEEERALNAAAAREVSRELDALSFQPPALENMPSEGSVSTAPGSFSEPRPGSNERRPSDASVRREPSPLIPPTALFSRRAVSPGIDTDVPRSGSPAGHVNSPSYSSQYGSPKMENAPPSIRLPDRSGMSGGTPYQTPPEYPVPSPRVPFGGPLNINKSTSSLNPTTPVGGASGGKISAAAFRRPVPRMGSGPSLPSSPQVRGGSPLPPPGGVGLGKVETLYGNSNSSHPSLKLRDAIDPPTERTNSQAYDDNYDYISSFSSPEADLDTGSPVKSDYGALGNVRVVNTEENGYGGGKFSTDLDGTQGGRFGRH